MALVSHTGSKTERGFEDYSNRDVAGCSTGQQCFGCAGERVLLTSTRGAKFGAYAGSQTKRGLLTHRDGVVGDVLRSSLAHVQPAPPPFSPHLDVDVDVDVVVNFLSHPPISHAVEENRRLVATARRHACTRTRTRHCFRAARRQLPPLYRIPESIRPNAALDSRHGRHGEVLYLPQRQHTAMAAGRHGTGGKGRRHARGPGQGARLDVPLREAHDRIHRVNTAGAHGRRTRGRCTIADGTGRRIGQSEAQDTIGPVWSRLRAVEVPPAHNGRDELRRRHAEVVRATGARDRHRSQHATQGQDGGENE